MSDHPEIEIQQQTAFGEDGELEVTETSVETSLETSAQTSIIATATRGSTDPKRVSSASTTGPK